MKIFESAIIFHPAPTETQRLSGERPKSVMLVEPKYFLAADEKEASLVAARDIPGDYTDKLDRIEVVLRPF